MTAVLGFADKSAVILEEEMKKYADVIVTTDNGSYGCQGYVSAVVDELSPRLCGCLFLWSASYAPVCGS